MCDANDTRAEEISLFGDSNEWETDSNASTLPLNGITTADHMTTQQLHRRYFPNSNATSPIPMRVAPSPTMLPGDLQPEPVVVLPLMSQRQMRQRMVSDTAPDEAALAESMAQERFEQRVLEIIQSEETPNPAGEKRRQIQQELSTIGNPIPVTPVTRPAAEEFLARAEMAHEDWLQGGVVHQQFFENGASGDSSIFHFLLHYSRSRTTRYRDAASVMSQDDPDSATLRQMAAMEDEFVARVDRVRHRARDRSFEMAEAYLRSKGNPCPYLIYHHTKPPSVISTILEVFFQSDPVQM